MSNQSNDNDKQNDQHQRSVETLGLSGHGDTDIIPEIYQLCLDNDLVLTKDQALAIQDEILKARIDERKQVISETQHEQEATEKAEAFVNPAGLDGYKCAIRDVLLDQKDRLAALQSQLTESPKEGE